MLGESGAVDVRIEPHRHIQRATDRSGKIGVRPARLWRGRDVAEMRRATVRIDRAKRGDPDCSKWQRPQMRTEECDGSSDRFFGSSRGKTCLDVEMIGVNTDRADELRAARL